MRSAWGSDEVWDRLAYGEAAGGRLHRTRLEGVGRNPAAPDAVRIRLLDVHPGMLWQRFLPAAVLEAAADHPQWAVRARLAEVQTYRGANEGLPGGLWSRLVLGEPGSARRGLLVELAAGAGAELTDAAYEALAADPAYAVRVQAAGLRGLPPRLREALAADEAAGVRAAVCEAAWSELDSGTRARLAADPDPAVRAAVTPARHEEVPLTVEFFDADPGARHHIGDRRLERRLAVRLSTDGDPSTRRDLAANPYLDPDLVESLAADPQDDVRLAASLHPGLTEERRAAVEMEIDPGRMRYPIPWVVALHDDPAAMRRLAGSAHLLLRSSVAMARRLPPDVVERLARDEDRVVRLFLAENCDDAPADLLLEVWQWWSGSYSTPDRPYGHPNFPRRDLLRFADDPHPRLRQLALDDPDSTPELVERFSRDADMEVRRRAATDPRLSAESVVRLLDDPEAGVRDTAARHPRVPTPVLAGLLGNEDTAGAAAQNPALPVGVMLWLIGG